MYILVSVERLPRAVNPCKLRQHKVSNGVLVAERSTVATEAEPCP